MKKIRIILTIMVISFGSLQAQVIHHRDSDSRHMAGITMGMNSGIVYGIHHSYSLDLWNQDMEVSTSFMLPIGSDIVDDFALLSGLEWDFYQWESIHVSLGLQGGLRRIETETVRIHSIAMNSSLRVGYFRPMWFASVKADWDQPLLNHHKHSDFYKEYTYSEVKDGWYSSSGGLVHYGLEAGISWDSLGITLELFQERDTVTWQTPDFDLYALIGMNLYL